ncbi:CD109 antigen-like protein [Leptotrombidium deliense]|uniref:CD109 antigen-like protein n=1 Tax=Leptotrombidium deliense TaxID=299467 RepID=A0A443S001_9ACAR|nr:CD109 antigen-like protein [Leptotrombidium deliense]
MQIQLEASVKPEEYIDVFITPENLAKQTRLPIGPPVYGHVTALSKGAGLAIMQLSTKYNVDRDFLLLKPAVKAFDISFSMSATGRNKSTIFLSACSKWMLTNESSRSDIAIMELDIPTGYFQNKAVIDRYVAKAAVPNLKKAKVLPKSAVFMFEYLTQDWSCVNVTLDRWFPVANSTRYMKAKVYELNRPGLFAEAILDNLVLNIINICEVCGSFQCPYCPFFSKALFTLPNTAFMFFAFILNFVICKYCI